MRFSSIRHVLAAFLVAVLVSACGGGAGSSAPPPTGGVTVTPGDGVVTLTWNADPGVKYWVFYAPANSINTTDWLSVPNSRAILDVTSPYVVTGLTNGYTYAFAINGRVGDGPGGPGSQSVTAIPRPAGETWSSVGGIGNANMRGIAYGINPADTLAYYLAVGDSGNTYRSTDGLAWAGMGPAANTDMYAAINTFGKFIVTGAGGTITYSTDMVSWAAATTNTTQTINAIASSGALAIAVGNNGTLLASGDGVSWSAIAIPTTRNLYGVAYSTSGVWTVVGAGGILFESVNGSTWVPVASGTTADLHAVAVQLAVGYTFVATGDNGTVIRSVDNGATWSVQNSTSPANLLALSATPSQFLAVGSGGAVLTSPDGVTWYVRSSATTANLNAVINASGLAQYVAVGQGGANVMAK